MVVAEHEHERGQLDAVGDRGEISEDGQRIPVGATAYRRDVDGHRHVLTARAEVVAQGLGRGHDVRDLGDARGLLPLRVGLGESGDDGRDDAEAEGG